MFESEERRITERIKDYIKSKNFPGFYNIIMLRNGHILRFDDYRDMIISGKINPQDVYVDIRIDGGPSKAVFYYPLLEQYNVFPDAYLSKLGFYYVAMVFPATGLKYIVICARYENYLAIEVSNLDTVVSNTNLPKFVVEALDGKLISGEKKLTGKEYEKILYMYESQKLFAGYNFDKAWNIIKDYYDRGDQSRTKEVARIAMDYDRIFQPYRVCYNMKTWKEIDCSSINLD